ncbi:oxidoreductase : Putative dehydrogenase OS=Singulisphaera acidiphila (strain ATCC BAA-1392 / DSM 18658 / VKM B-2454 / MOB10) GN=Sinac_6980 PE=4 SV=1: TAT_signal: GFO_IDH_MocA [Gemmata massiliana]|uniref:Gfo/Idh/MocA-like oxidoreductase N-terminal domain-containing protein n=1 Tax=Gemmata massiliana TaxID=1210884 RepID=A0A6P2DIM9_9BACT|nr:Gfo/Idh/MocA family oxidoreductase [Gemmata massiliana]VTS01284.1 oxidoreductase : Putative dehydrogenase OS=Singulisphaera acidiphila (strain ATCC BAA-1392 / DSM 18658 / VKM B-2454 / MOB10) GN=Sinac_6980 PE=4 SV=1: TAT_signal: GFO_IDH_MocA [Gemmata massiliana]
MPQPSPSRRTFLKTSAAAGAALTAPGFLRARNANEKLNIAIIGAGGRGAANLNGVAGENIVALCDVSTAAVEKVAAVHKSARKFADFRKVFDHVKDFDAVVVSTCEHTHAFATLLALQHGKHVYCEKPLTHNIAEARIIREAAAKTKLATQMGTQIHAEDNYRRVVELIQTGAIGPVREVHVWVNRAWGFQSAEDAKANKDIYVTERPKDDVKPPADLDWNLWLGPVADRPFSPIYVPGPKWYRWWDFGNGTMSDLGSHWNDLPFWALKLKAPTAVEASGPKPHPEIAPASMQATYEFPARGEMPAVKMTWHQGSYRPPQWTEKKIPQWGSGVLFVGDKGMLLSEYFKHVLLPEKQFAEFVRPKPFIEKSRGHYAEWIHACKTGAPTTCNFEYAGWLTESNHLGNVAFRAGKRLEWDAVKMKATNCPEADAFIHREYRKGWKLA